MITDLFSSRDVFIFTPVRYQLVMGPFSYHLPLQWICDHSKLLTGDRAYRIQNNP